MRSREGKGSDWFDSGTLSKNKSANPILSCTHSPLNRCLETASDWMSPFLWGPCWAARNQSSARWIKIEGASDLVNRISTGLFSIQTHCIWRAGGRLHLFVEVPGWALHFTTASTSIWTWDIKQKILFYRKTIILGLSGSLYRMYIIVMYAKFHYILSTPVWLIYIFKISNYINIMQKVIHLADAFIQVTYKENC